MKVLGMSRKHAALKTGEDTPVCGGQRTSNRACLLRVGEQKT